MNAHLALRAKVWHPATWSEVELRVWDHAMARARHGGFVYALLYFVVAGVRI